MPGYTDLRQLLIDSWKTPIWIYKGAVAVPVGFRKARIGTANKLYLRLNGVRASVETRPRINAAIQGGNHDARVEGFAQIDLWVNNRNHNDAVVDVASGKLTVRRRAYLGHDLVHTFILRGNSPDPKTYQIPRKTVRYLLQLNFRSSAVVPQSEWAHLGDEAAKWRLSGIRVRLQRGIGEMDVPLNAVGDRIKEEELV